MTASFLDIRFILALCLIALARLVWPKKYYVLYGALSSALIIGLSAPRSLIVISGVTLLLIFPLRILGLYSEKLHVPRSFSKSLMPVGIIGLVALLLFFKINRQFTIPWRNLVTREHLSPNRIFLFYFSRYRLFAHPNHFKTE
jgi:hypothetical protein